MIWTPKPHNNQSPAFFSAMFIHTFRPCTPLFWLAGHSNLEQPHRSEFVHLKIVFLLAAKFRSVPPNFNQTNFRVDFDTGHVWRNNVFHMFKSRRRQAENPCLTMSRVSDMQLLAVCPPAVPLAGSFSGQADCSIRLAQDLNLAASHISPLTKIGRLH
jgi:hypothetical protein